MFRKKIPYLCGSMSNLKGYGAAWRKSIRKWFDERGVKAYDPCIEETKEHKKYDLNRVPKHHWEGYPQPLQEEILKKDLDQVKYYTNYVLCYFTQFSTGTVSELSFALYEKIPVYIVTTRRLKGWPHTVGNAEGNKVFKSFKELKKFLTVKYKLKKQNGNKNQKSV